MKELIAYYNNRKKFFRIVAIIIWLLSLLMFTQLNKYATVLLEYIAKNSINIINTQNVIIIQTILDLLLDFFAPSAIALFSYSIILKYIDEKGWKKKYPELDISGTWKDITHYVQCMDDNGISDIDTTHYESSPVIIEQTCRKVRILDSVGDGFKWHSLLCDWEGSKLNILYEVEYFASLQQKGFPEKRYGYECMCIDAQDQALKAKPNKMVGKFWHCCASDKKPVYMGDVTYERDAE